MQKTNLSWEETKERAEKVVGIMLLRTDKIQQPWKLYGVPRGGIPTALLISQVLMRHNVSSILTESPINANFIIDDIIDTGKTQSRYDDEEYDDMPFFALVNKQQADKDIGWVVFPWEKMAGEEGPEENIIRILEYIGEDPKREGLKDTPKRIIKSIWRLCSKHKRF